MEKKRQDTHSHAEIECFNAFIISIFKTSY